MTSIEPISRIPTTPKPAAKPSLWNLIYDEIDDRLKKLNDGKQDSGSGMDGFAPINSPVFTGNPTAPTPSAGDSDTSLATTGFVQNAILSAVTAALTGISMVPTGTVIYVAMSAAPDGYLKANGSAVSRTTYAALFSAVGVNFGAGDSINTFNLPDLRGEFIRGFDDGRGVDAGRTLGSSQADEFKTHEHIFGGDDQMGSVMGYTRLVTYPYDATSTVTGGTGGEFHTKPDTSNFGGPETRPRNVALLACIKY